MEADREPLPSAAVLHVITRYGLGGSERRLRDAIAATPELHHSVVVGAEYDAARLHADLPAAVPVDVVPSLVRRPSPLREPRAYRWLSKRLAAGDVDLVHTHQSKAGVLGRVAATRRRVPAVHSLSMANFGEGFGGGTSAVYRVIERALGRRTARYAAVGDDLRSRYGRAGVPAERIAVIRSSIELAAFRGAPDAEAAAAALGFDRAPGVVAFVGRFDKLKGVAELPALLRGIRARRGSAPVLVLAGDGPLRTTVVAECVAAAGGAPVVDLGHTPRVPEVMAAADVVVLLSRSEGVPQVLVQALASGRPFVSYAADGAGELAARPGAESCRVVPIGDLDAAVDGVVALLDAPAHPAVELEEWSQAAVYAAYRSLYRELLGG